MSSEPITCIWITIKDTASCDLTKATLGDFHFEARRHLGAVYIGGAFVSFPAVFYRTFDSTNVYSVEYPRASISVPHVITECNPGYIGFREDASWESTTISCEHSLNTCSNRPNPGFTTSCSDYDILLRCTLHEGASFKECVLSEVGYCQNQKQVSGNNAYWDNEGKLATAACFPTSDHCPSSHYFDMSDLKCKPVRHCGKFNTGTPYDLSYNDPDFMNGNSYAGRCTCETNIQITPGVFISYFLNANDKTETQCILCSACGSNQYVNQTCFSEWQMVDTSTVRKPMLVSVDTVCESCDDACPVGQYSVCEANRVCLDCHCEGGCGARFCLVNDTVCDGTRHENLGAICTTYESVLCPVGTYANTEFQASGLVHSVATLKTDMCISCLEDAPVCQTGYMWPGCQEEGLTINTPCMSCPTLPDNAYFVETDSSHYCKWVCLEDFYRVTDSTPANGTCVSCRDITCPAGFFQITCPEGSNSLTRPLCYPCTVSTESCADNYYRHQCDGHGYGTDTSDCTPCRDPLEVADSCEVDEFFKPCTGAPWFDASRCEQCDVINAIPAGAISIGGDVDCDFACKPGYFHKQNGCAECKTSVQHCSGCSQLDTPLDCEDAYMIGNCSSYAKDADVDCFCRPGFGKSALGACTACHSFHISKGGLIGDEDEVPCVECPRGYSGATEHGSSECVPCPVNTYHPSPSMEQSDNQIAPPPGCLLCDTGTGGLLGSTKCQSCQNGQMAVLQPWEGFVKTYPAYALAEPEWVAWTGPLPNQCVLRNERTDQLETLCPSPGDLRGIRWCLEATDTASGGFDINSITPTFGCDSCPGGFAYSTNFDAIK